MPRTRRGTGQDGPLSPPSQPSTDQESLGEPENDSPAKRVKKRRERKRKKGQKYGSKEQKAAGKLVDDVDVVVEGSAEHKALMRDQERKMKSFRSPVWQHFTFQWCEPTDVLKWQVRCNKCGKMMDHLRGSGNGTTTTLERHLQGHGIYLHNKEKKDKVLRRYVMPGRFWMTHQGIPAAYNCTMRQKREAIEGKAASLCIDGWKNVTGKNVWGACLRWADHAQGKHKIVYNQFTSNLRYMEGCVRASVVTDFIESQLSQWGLQGTQDRPIFITTDKGSNVKAACQKLQYMEWIPCFSHVQQRAVFSTMDKLRAGKPMQRLMAVTTLLKRSQPLLSLWLSWQEKKGQSYHLVYPSPTRWGGFYLAARRWVKVAEEFATWVAQDTRLDDEQRGKLHAAMPDVPDTKALKALVFVLFCCYTREHALEDPKVPSGVLYFRYVSTLWDDLELLTKDRRDMTVQQKQALATFATSQHGGLGLLGELNSKTRRKIATRLQKELKKRFTQEDFLPMLRLAYFDPCIAGSQVPKWLRDSLSQQQQQRLLADVRCDIEDRLLAFHAEVGRPGHRRRTGDARDEQGAGPSSQGTDDTAERQRRNFHTGLSKGFVTAGPDTASVATHVIEEEMLRYENLDTRTQYADPGVFWASHTKLLPYLSALALTYLGVSATAVRCEQVWSQTGRIHTSDRVRMSFRTLVQLAFLRENADVQYLEANLTVGDYKRARCQYLALSRVRQRERAAQSLALELPACVDAAVDPPARGTAAVGDSPQDGGGAGASGAQQVQHGGSSGGGSGGGDGTHNSGSNVEPELDELDADPFEDVPDEQMVEVEEELNDAIYYCSACSDFGEISKHVKNTDVIDSDNSSFWFSDD